MSLPTNVMLAFIRYCISSQSLKHIGNAHPQQSTWTSQVLGKFDDLFNRLPSPFCNPPK